MRLWLQHQHMHYSTECLVLSVNTGALDSRHVSLSIFTACDLHVLQPVPNHSQMQLLTIKQRAPTCGSSLPGAGSAGLLGSSGSAGFTPDPGFVVSPSPLGSCC
jgi:hypothetical protein